MTSIDQRQASDEEDKIIPFGIIQKNVRKPPERNVLILIPIPSLEGKDKQRGEKDAKKVGSSNSYFSKTTILAVVGMLRLREVRCV